MAIPVRNPLDPSECFHHLAPDYRYECIAGRMVRVERCPICGAIGYRKPSRKQEKREVFRTWED